MDNLLSGILGAIIGSLISIIYFHFNEASKARKDVAIQTIEYIENLYNNLTVLSNSKFSNKEDIFISFLVEKEMKDKFTEIAHLICNFTPLAKMKFSYKNNEINDTASSLMESFKIALHSIDKGEEKKYKNITTNEIDQKYQELNKLLEIHSGVLNGIYYNVKRKLTNKDR